MALDLGTLVGHVDLDTRDYDSKYRQVRTAWTQLGQQAPADLTVRAQVTAALADVDRARAAVRAFDGTQAEAEVSADYQAAVADLEVAEAAVRALDGDEATVEALADVDRATSGLGEVESSIRSLNGERAVVEVDADTSDAEQELDGFGDVARDEGTEGGKGFMTGVLAGVASIPIVGALVMVGKSMVDSVLSGFDIDAQRDLFGARTGLDEATSAKFGRAAGEAYANNWGESVESNLEVARQAFANGLIDPRATEADTARIISQFQAVAQVMDEDVSIAARAAGNMIKNNLVRDVEGAVDLMMAAQQRGINVSEDFFDTFIEYSGNFKQAGIDGATAMGLMDQAIREGAFNTDVLGDTIKEFGLRVRENTQPVQDAFKAIGIDADEMRDKMVEGGPAAAEAFQTVLERLRELEEQGLPTQQAVTDIFGGPGENLGPALFALDLEAAGAAMDDVAGTAESAMARIGSNTATQMESARRNVELAMDGIKGALAAAFSEELDGAAQWVQRNRGPMLEFLSDVVNGIFDLALAGVEGGASLVESFGSFVSSTLPSIMEGLALATTALGVLTEDAELAVSGIRMQFAADEMRGFADTTAEAADAMRTNLGGALEDSRDRFNEWAAPEIMAGHLHDIVTATAGRMAEVEDLVSSTEPTFTINGDTGNADTALAAVLAAIEAGEGAVMVNGETVLAEDALDEVLRLIASGEENITIGAESLPGENALEVLLRAVANGEESVTIDGETVDAEASLAALMDDVRGSGEEVTIGGRTVPAEDALAATLNAVRRGKENVTIGGATVPARDSTNSLLTWVRNRRAAIRADADTRWARSDVLHWQPPRKRIPTDADLSGARWALANWHPRKTVGITGVMMQAGGGPVVGLAGGGPVNGSGPKGVDSVPAGLAGGPVSHVLAPGEHVWADDEVDAAGGHRGMYRLRRMARDGSLAALLAAQPLAGGGEIGGGTSGAASAVMARLDPEDRALLRALATRPVQFKIDHRILAESAAAAGDYGRDRGQGGGF